MTKIIKERWMKLAGIVNESSYHMVKHDQIAKTVERHVAEMLKELGINSDVGELVFDDLYHTIKRYLTSALTESAESEKRQKHHTNFGTSDQVDGPYDKVVDNQPMNVDKNINKHLVEIGSPEDRWPAREDEEEGRAALGDINNKYPKTAAEYAEELNKKTEGPFKLATEPEHWDQYGVRTGEELAKYLAIETYRDVYKDVNGVRPRHVKFDSVSIEEIESMTDELLKSFEGEDDTSWLRDLD